MIMELEGDSDPCVPGSLVRQPGDIPVSEVACCLRAV